MGIPAGLEEIVQFADNADAGAIVGQWDRPEPRILGFGVHDERRAFVDAFVSVRAFKMREKRCHFQVRFRRVHVQLPADEGTLSSGIDNDGGMNSLRFRSARVCPSRSGVLNHNPHRCVILKKHLAHTGTAADFYAFLGCILQKPLVKFTPQHLPCDSTFVRVRLKEIERFGGFPGT